MLRSRGHSLRASCRLVLSSNAQRPIGGKGKGIGEMLRTVLTASLTLLLVVSTGQASVVFDTSPVGARGSEMFNLEGDLGDLDIRLPSRSKTAAGAAVSGDVWAAAEQWGDLAESGEPTFWADMMSASAFDHRGLESLHSATRNLWPHDIERSRGRDAGEALLWQFHSRGAEETGVSSEELQSEAWMWVSSGIYRADPTETASLVEVFRQQAPTR